MTDTSVPADRVTFIKLVENGKGDITSATRVANCLLIMPETTCYLMGLPAGATFQRGASKVAARLAAGEQPLLA